VFKIDGFFLYILVTKWYDLKVYAIADLLRSKYYQM